jgi:hypothetical protein
MTEPVQPRPRGCTGYGSILWLGLLVFPPQIRVLKIERFSPLDVFANRVTGHDAGHVDTHEMVRQFANLHAAHADISVLKDSSSSQILCCNHDTECLVWLVPSLCPPPLHVGCDLSSASDGED